MVIPFVNKIERGKDWIAGISVTDANWNGNYVEITFSLKFSYEVAKHLIHLPGQQGFSIPIDKQQMISGNKDNTAKARKGIHCGSKKCPNRKFAVRKMICSRLTSFVTRTILFKPSSQGEES